MQDKVVYIRFNRQIYLNNQHLVWQLMYKAVSPSYIIYMVVTGITLCVGIAVDLKGGFPLPTMVGIGMLISILLRFRHVRKVKRNFFGRAEQIANQHELELGDYLYNFTNQGITYTDNLNSVTQNWDLFEPVSEYQLALIIKLKESDKVHYIISTQEVGDENYREISTILTERLGWEK